jgi:hypothetical protein
MNAIWLEPASKTDGKLRRKNRRKVEVTSLTLGTGGKRLWLLRSRPDQVDRPSMRGGPSRRILSLVALQCESPPHGNHAERITPSENPAEQKVARRLAVGWARASGSCNRPRHLNMVGMEPAVPLKRAPNVGQPTETLLPV